MRDRTTRDEPIGGQCSNGRITVTELAVMYGLALVVPAFLWAITNPVLAAGIVAFVGGAYVLARIGARLVQSSSGDETGNAGGTNGRAAD